MRYTMSNDGIPRATIFIKVRVSREARQALARHARHLELRTYREVLRQHLSDYVNLVVWDEMEECDDCKKATKPRALEEEEP